MSSTNDKVKAILDQAFTDLMAVGATPETAAKLALTGVACRLRCGVPEAIYHLAAMEYGDAKTYADFLEQHEARMAQDDPNHLSNQANGSGEPH